MKTIKELFSVTLMLLATCIVSSCGEDEPTYIQAEMLNSAQVFFPTSSNSSINLPGNEDSFEIEIARLNTDGAITVPLTLTGGDGLYTAPSSVSFAQGEAKASVAISYDAAKIGPDNYMDITLSIADATMTTPYGMANYTVSVGIPQTYTARYLGDYTYSLYWTGDDSGLTLYQSDIYPERWKIAHWGSDVDFFFTWNQETNEILVDEQFCANHSTYGPVTIDDLVHYTGGTKYGQSYYEDGVFHFAVVYYVSAGSFGNGEETFVVTEQFMK